MINTTPKIMLSLEVHDLGSLSVLELRGNFQVYEIERFGEHMEKTKKKLSLNILTDGEQSFNEEISFLTPRIKSLIRRKQNYQSNSSSSLKHSSDKRNHYESDSSYRKPNYDSKLFLK